MSGDGTTLIFLSASAIDVNKCGQCATTMKKTKAIGPQNNALVVVVLFPALLHLPTYEMN